MGQGRVYGGQFLRVSENIYQAGGVNRMGQGRVYGGQSLKTKTPGTQSLVPGVLFKSLALNIL